MSRAMQFDIVANDKASATMGNVEKSMDGFSKKVGTSLTAVAARAAVIVATFQRVAAVINEAGDVADQAARLGLSVEKYQQLKFAAEDYGSSIEEIAKAQKDVNKLLDAAATKQQGPEMQTLQALGFSDADILNRNIKQAEVFERIGEAIKTAASEEEKFATASRVFGDKIATSMIPVLENYKQFQVMSASTTTMTEKSAQNLDRLGTKLNGFIQFMKAGTSEIAGKIAGAIMDEEPKLAVTPSTDAEAKAKGEKMRNALLKVGAKNGGKGDGAEGVSSMMAIGGASFRGFQQALAQPIEEQQLAALEQIASNTAPAQESTTPPAIGSTDGTKANPVLSSYEATTQAIRMSGAHRGSVAEQMKRHRPAR